MALFKRKIQVLFVCTENLCRSPMAEGLLRDHLKRAGLGSKVKVSSAGTIAGRPGAKADARAVKVASAAGVNLRKIRASRVTMPELASSDLIVALDRKHYRELLKICPHDHADKIKLLLGYLPGDGAKNDVPDPYYGSSDGFKDNYELIERAVRGMVRCVGDMVAEI